LPPSSRGSKVTSHKMFSYTDNSTRNVRVILMAPVELYDALLYKIKERNLMKAVNHVFVNV